MTMNMSRIRILEYVNRFCMYFPPSMPRVLIQVKSRISRMETSCVVLKWSGPAENRMFLSAIHGSMTPRNFEKAMATAAIVPHWMTRKSVQPYKNPNKGEYASLR